MLGVPLLASVVASSAGPAARPAWWSDLVAASVENGWAVEVPWRLDPSSGACFYAWIGAWVPPETLVLAPGEPRSGGVLECLDGPRVLVLEPGIPEDVRDCWPETRGSQMCATVAGRLSCEVVQVTLAPDAPPVGVGCWREPTLTLRPGGTVHAPVGEGCALQLRGGATDSVDLGPVEPGDVVRCAAAGGGVACAVEPWEP